MAARKRSFSTQQSRLVCSRRRASPAAVSLTNLMRTAEPEFWVYAAGRMEEAAGEGAEGAEEGEAGDAAEAEEGEGGDETVGSGLSG